MDAPPRNSGAGDDGAGSRWSQTPLRERLRWLRGFRLRLVDATDELCRLMEEEVGKPRHEALTGDLLPLLASCRWHERCARRVLRSRRPLGTPIWMLGQRHRVVRLALGEVAIIATWNYPVQLLGVQLVQALVAGNRVTVKPSERSARTQALLVELAARGLPEGTLRRYEADREAGRRLLEQERFDHVVFTGATATGQEIARHLASSLTPSTLELSGRDSALVLEDADPELAAERIWNMVRMNCGQTCMAPRRVLVHTDVYDRFCDAVRVQAVSPEPRAVIDQASADRVRRLIAGSGPDGVELVPDTPVSSDGRNTAATMVLHAAPDSELVEGDHFGPLCAVVRCEDLPAMLRIHRSCPQHLATSVFSASRQRVEELAPSLGAGTVIHNEVVIPTAHPGCSIHGRAQSGWGVSRGEQGLLAMTRSVHVASVPKRLRPPSGEPSPKQVAQLQKMMKFLYGRGRRS